MHCSIILGLLQLLNPKHCQWLQKLNASEAPFVSPGIWLLNDHFHPNQISEVFGYRSLDNTIGNVSISTNLPQLHLATANCVLQLVRQIQKVHPNIHLFYNVGLHPHMLYHYHCEKEPKFFLSHLKQGPKCLGIGEVGLDYTINCQCKHYHKERQRKISPRPRLMLKSPFCMYYFPKLNSIGVFWLYILMDLQLLIIWLSSIYATIISFGTISQGIKSYHKIHFHFYMGIEILS